MAANSGRAIVTTSSMVRLISATLSLGGRGRKGV
jgi:hypothetical protein